MYPRRTGRELVLLSSMGMSSQKCPRDSAPTQARYESHELPVVIARIVCWQTEDGLQGAIHTDHLNIPNEAGNQCTSSQYSCPNIATERIAQLAKGRKELAPES